MRVHIITIGDEILIGQTIDTNSAWMARQLNLIGAQVAEIQSVSDQKAAILDSLAHAVGQVEVVLITGGLGPTKDDITKLALAEFFDTELQFHQPTYDRILRMFEKWGRAPTPAHREQCYLPARARILVNKKGSAPAMWFEYQGKTIVSMPGVPFEMQYLMEYEVLPRLQKQYAGIPVLHRYIMTVGEGESRIAQHIADIEEQLPPPLKLAFLPGLGQVKLRLTASGADEALLTKLLNEQVRVISERISDFVYGYDEVKLEEVVGELLRNKGMHLCTVESCTGGYIAHLITSVPGSSDYFKGGIVVYSNDVKQRQLGVQASTLERRGAVSEEVVKEMVAGSLDVFDVDVAVAVSGVAGPGGGTPDKPVGTIWLAAGNRQRMVTQKLQLSKDRLLNIQYTGIEALNMIRKFLLEQ